MQDTRGASTDLVLRAPRVEELANLTRLCVRSKAVHGYGTPMLCAFLTELMVTQDDMETDEIIVAESASGVVGLAQVSHGKDGCHLEKLFIAPEAIGRGYGSVLFRWAADTARAGGAREMVIESDPGAAKFYRRMGARPAGIAASGSLPGRTLPRLTMALG